MSFLQKLFIVAAALLTALTDSFFIDETYNATTGWSVIRHIQMSMPLVIKLNNSLVHVLDSRDPDYPIRLESTDFTTCLVSLKLRYPSRYPRRAASLGNGKIVVWLLNYRLTPFKHLGEWRFIMVEPRSCTYEDFEIQDSDPYPIDVIGIVAYNDTFDALITSLTHEDTRFTYVYRYSDVGIPVSSFRISTIADLDSKPFYRPNTIRIHAVKEYDYREGYFYVQNKPTIYMTVIKRLNPELKITSSTKLKHSKLHAFDFNSYSTQFGNFTVCRFYERQQSIHCSLLDTRLNQHINVVLNYASKKGLTHRSLVHFNVMNTADAGVILTYGVKFSHTSIYVQRIGPEGIWTTDSVNVCNVACDIYDVKNFYMGNNKYCIVVTCDEEVHTRCIKLKLTDLSV